MKDVLKALNAVETVLVKGRECGARADMGTYVINCPDGGAAMGVRSRLYPDHDASRDHVSNPMYTAAAIDRVKKEWLAVAAVHRIHRLA